jgi:cytoskeletal protein CcmA (bactofilin family)
MWNQEPSPQREAGRQPQTAPPPTVARPVEERRVMAWVGKSVIFKGDLISSEDMTIDGRVEGTIDVKDHSLTIGPDADIRAEIVARTVIVLGVVTGSITAHEKVDIRDTGSVEGDILSPKLAIADGALLRGRVETTIRQSSQTEKRGQLTTA